MDLICRLYYKYLSWKDQRFLTKHGCNNWKEYYYKFDIDVNKYASNIKEYYGNYSYTYVFKNYSHPVYLGDAYKNDLTDPSGYAIIKNWCEDNCRGKWRSDIHRVLPENFFSGNPLLDIEDDDNWMLNDIGGYDFIFFAFMDETDYIWFIMRWK